jgi:hypothetical protein
MVNLYTTRFNIKQLYVLPTHCIYVFCMDLRTKANTGSAKKSIHTLRKENKEGVYILYFFFGGPCISRYSIN